ncbi:MAG: GTPase Era [Bdellovibrionales bacterium]|nr:GTPase Era [Bdellovibrionales bacterium]
MAFKAGYVGLFGMPNVGKSSFFNYLVGENLSIVSAKPQTTRTRRTGIIALDTDQGKGQALIVDAPGFLNEKRVDKKNKLMSFIADEALAVASDVEAFLLLIEINEIPKDEVKTFLEFLKKKKRPLGVVITKSDLKAEQKVLEFIEELKAENIPSFFVSVKGVKGPDWNRMMSFIHEALPESPGPLYDEEQYTTDTLRDIAAEMIREQCFLRLEKEIPYGIGVRIDSFKEDLKVPRIEASIIVEKSNHKAIVIGKGGAMLKEIGSEARKRIEKIYGQKIFLSLHVTPKEQWTTKERMVKELGYDRKS